MRRAISASQPAAVIQGFAALPAGAPYGTIGTEAIGELAHPAATIATRRAAADSRSLICGFSVLGS
jgi:hypothetical protein